MIKVSVILPVYGVAQFIENCVSSLLQQSLNEMEFIMVDDCGPDNSIELAQRMIEGHPRQAQFRFIRPNKNIGAGMARNFGIAHAQGEYVGFVDPDDWVEPTMFEELYLQAKRYDSDLCCCQLRKITPNNEQTLKHPYIGNGAITSEGRRRYLTHYVSYFTSFLYRRDWLTENRIAFPEGHCGEDSFFVFCAVMQARSLAYVEKPFYNYLVRNDSASQSLNPERYRQRMNTFGLLVNYAHQQLLYEPYANEIDFIYIKKGYLGTMLNYAYNHPHPQRSDLRAIRQELRHRAPKYKHNPYLHKSIPLLMLTTLLGIVPCISTRVLRVVVQSKGMSV